jgi:hypothetical protein
VTVTLFLGPFDGHQTEIDGAVVRLCEDGGIPVEIELHDGPASHTYRLEPRLARATYREAP